MAEPKPVFEFDITLNPVESPTVHQVKAEQKAMLLCWMWLADLTITKRGYRKEKPIHMNVAADIASDFMKKMFKLDVTAQSINKFYESGQKSAKHAGFNWNNTVAARIERSLGRLKYSDFEKFLLEYREIKPYPSDSALMMMRAVNFQASETCRELLECWERFASGKLIRPPHLDAELEVEHDTSQPPLTPTQKIQQEADPGLVNDDQKE